MARKEITEKYNKYKVFYLVKIVKSTNLTYVVDRIRGVKNVIVAMPEHSDRLEDLSKRSNDYEFYLIKVKFMTDKSPIDVAKKIKFDAGCLEKSWHKNCAAIGLSSSFIEPLEASSIGTSIQQAMILCEVLPYYVENNTKAEKTFNKHSDDILQNILDFVALHYITKRNDTSYT